jgi:Tfp pilus assembly protein PilV
MDWSAHNAGFVLVSYIITALGLLGMAGFIISRDRNRAKALRQNKD